MMFKDRVDAGMHLARKLGKMKDRDCVILAIPRGGVAVGYGIAKALKIPLGIIVARKLPIPFDPEAGFGAIVGNEIVLNEALVERLNISDKDIRQVVKEVKLELKRRAKIYDKKYAVPIEGRTVILVDDGLASGFTMLAALRCLKSKKPKKIVVAVPTASASALGALEKEIGSKNVISLNVSHELVFAVANFYEDFPDLTDDQVIDFLEDVKSSRKQ